MPKIVAIHSVADVAAWLTFHDERAGAVGQLGGTNVTDYVAEDGSSNIAITADVDDVEALVTTLSNPPTEMAEVMAGHGVQLPITVYVQA